MDGERLDITPAIAGCLAINSSPAALHGKAIGVTQKAPSHSRVKRLPGVREAEEGTGAGWTVFWGAGWLAKTAQTRNREIHFQIGFATCCQNWPKPSRNRHGDGSMTVP